MIYKKVILWVAACMMVGSAAGCVGDEKGVPIHQEDFSSARRVKGVYLTGKEGGQYKPSKNSLEITAIPNTTYAVYSDSLVSGNFYAETEFTADDAVGLVLFKNKGGVPDTDNYTMICVTTRGGVVYINHYDRQNGIDNVHDPRQPSKIAPTRYQAKLDGTVYSIPYKQTNKKLRILHESLSNTFHFYYGTRLEKWGVTSNDWMELAPLYSWLPTDEAYFVGVVCRNERNEEGKKAVYKHLNIVQTPVEDIDDSTTGFKVVHRDYTWSGFSGDATVVTFGDEFAYDKNIKFIFWDRNNNAPMWRLNNQFELNFEFSEGGDRLFQGCHEAMSDRQRHGQYVKVLEDNAVRKRVLWHGISLNPDYHHSGEETPGGDKPTYDEYWTFYPDGTTIRQLIDKPKVDVAGRCRSWGPEFIELMPIGGSLVEAGDLCNEPALTLMDMTGRVNDFHPPVSKTFSPDTWNWEQIIFNAHFKENLPDFYLVYSQSEKYPDTWCGLTLQGQLSWQSPKHKFSHWPVGREPYGQNVGPNLVSSQSHSSYANEVTHTSLVSAGFYEKGADFADNYKTDPADGRKYRSHVMLAGLTRPFDKDAIRDEVHTWLFPGKISMLSKGCSYTKNNYEERCLEFADKSRRGKCTFSVVAGERAIVNPVVKIVGWGGIIDVKVKVDGKEVKSISAIEGDDLLVWINVRIDSTGVISINDSASYEVTLSNDTSLRVGK